MPFYLHEYKCMHVDAYIFCVRACVCVNTSVLAYVSICELMLVSVLVSACEPGCVCL